MGQKSRNEMKNVKDRFKPQMKNVKFHNWKSWNSTNEENKIPQTNEKAEIPQMKKVKISKWKYWKSITENWRTTNWKSSTLTDSTAPYVSLPLIFRWSRNNFRGFFVFEVLSLILFLSKYGGQLNPLALINGEIKNP